MTAVSRGAALGAVCGLAGGAAMAVAYLLAETRRKGRVMAVLGTLLACACALLVHVNIYELMFHPVKQPSFGPAAGSHLDGREEVIAVKVRGEARAYPVRIISYHHIVNDAVGGVPIVATY